MGGGGVYTPAHKWKIKKTELHKLKACINLLTLINLENGGVLPSWIQILLLTALNILLNNYLGYWLAVIKYPNSSERR